MTGFDETWGAPVSCPPCTRRASVHSTLDSQYGNRIVEPFAMFVTLQPLREILCSAPTTGDTCLEVVVLTRLITTSAPQRSKRDGSRRRASTLRHGAQGESLVTALFSLAVMSCPAEDSVMTVSRTSHVLCPALPWRNRPEMRFLGLLRRVW